MASTPDRHGKVLIDLCFERDPVEALQRLQRPGPGGLMIRLRPDFGVPGEGERGFPQLISALEGRKRGYPPRCDYCTYPIIEGRVGRARETVAVVEEMFRALDLVVGLEEETGLDVSEEELEAIRIVQDVVEHRQGTRWVGTPC